MGYELFKNRREYLVIRIMPVFFFHECALIRDHDPLHSVQKITMLLTIGEYNDHNMQKKYYIWFIQ